MGDRLPTALTLIEDRLDELHELLTDEPVDVVTERYHAWKSATRAALAEVVVESVLRRFDLAGGAPNHGDGRRPTPPVFLDAAASRACLMVIRKDLEADAPGGIGKVIDLLERRLPRAFRGRPEEERDLKNGFETLLAGAGIAYERDPDSIGYASRTYVPDFTFPGLQAALKLKLCDRPDRETQILAELDQEIPALQTRYPNLVFGVYDLGFIQDTDRLSRTFDARDGVLVLVMKQL
jgi:hypothetical protein